MKAAALVLLLMFGGSVRAQENADMKIADVLNSKDLFLLREQYAKLKGSMKIDVLDLLAQSMLGVAFNDRNAAKLAMDELMQYHQRELGQENCYNITLLQAMNMINMGMYKQAGWIASDLAVALEEYATPESLKGMAFIDRIGKALADFPAPRMDRPKHDVKVPMRHAKVGRGEHIYISVEVNGVTRDFVFDTSCPFGNLVSEEYAEEAGLTIVADSIPVTGLATGYAKLATAKVLKVGKMEYHNPVFMVMPSNPEDSVFMYDGILGCDFIREAREVIIDNEAGQFIFPRKISTGDVNIETSSNTPRVRIEYDGKPFVMNLDTGNVKSDLGEDFSTAFPEAVAGLEPFDTKRESFDGVDKLKVVTLPEFRFRVGGADAVLHDVDAISNVLLGSGTGSLGSDFVLSFKRVTINYENTFIRCE